MFFIQKYINPKKQSLQVLNFFLWFVNLKFEYQKYQDKISLRKIKGRGIKKSKPTQDFIRLSAILNKEKFIKCRVYLIFFIVLSLNQCI